MIENVFMGAFTAFVAFLVGAPLGWGYARNLQRDIVVTDERFNQPTQVAYGPKGIAEYYRRRAGFNRAAVFLIVVFVTITAFSLIAGIAVGFDLSESLFGTAIMFVVMAVMSGAMVASITFDRTKLQLVCPHCNHQIPVDTQWLCPYKNCETTNPRQAYGVIETLFGGEANSWLGNQCGGCHQAPAGFICTSCKEPIYFTDVAKRQRRELCAVARGYEDDRITKPPKQTAESIKGEEEAFVEKLIRTEGGWTRAEAMLEKALRELTKDMSPKEAREVTETIRDKFASKRRRDRVKLVD